MCSYSALHLVGRGCSACRGWKCHGKWTENDWTGDFGMKDRFS